MQTEAFHSWCRWSRWRVEQGRTWVIGGHAKQLEPAAGSEFIHIVLQLLLAHSLECPSQHSQAPTTCLFAYATGRIILFNRCFLHAAESKLRITCSIA